MCEKREETLLVLARCSVWNASASGSVAAGNAWVVRAAKPSAAEGEVPAVGDGAARLPASSAGAREHDEGNRCINVREGRRQRWAIAPNGMAFQSLVPH